MTRDELNQYFAVFAAIIIVICPLVIACVVIVGTVQ